MTNCLHLKLRNEVETIDAVPDAWYDVWKELEGSITFRRDFPGYYEIDVVEQNVF